MKVYRDRRVQVPSCKGIVRCKNKGKVLYRLPLGYSNAQNVQSESPCIGYLCEDAPSFMYPNDNFRIIFASVWEKLFNEKPTPAIKKIGMYAAVKAIDISTGLRNMLNSSFGEPQANALIDFAMYSILFSTNVADHFSANMYDYLLFSNFPYSDAYYSDLFKRGMPWKNITSFSIAWANWCKKKKCVDAVYLCIDGSNEDCDSRGVEFAEKGHSKSGKNKNIISFTYAITEEGMPVAYKVYRGGLVDAKAMKRILNFLNELDIKVKGVIIDRGYCSTDVFDYLRNKEISYVVMVKGKPEGFTRVYEEYGKHLHCGDSFIPGTELYAIQHKVTLYKKATYDDYLTVFFNPVNASGQETALMKKVNKEIYRIDKLLSTGQQAKVSSDMEELVYIDTKKNPDGTNTEKAKVNPIGYNEALSEKGVYSILTSEELPIFEVDRLYNCRDASEKTYSIVKRQLGYGTMHIHCTLGVQSKFLLGFVCSIIRYFIEKASLDIGRGTNQTIDDLKKISIERINRQYFFDDADNERAKKVLLKLGADKDILMTVTEETNNRAVEAMPQVRRKKPGPKKGSHHVLVDKDGAVVRRKPGPKPGSKKTDINKDGSPRKKPGPKPGFKRGNTNADGSPRQKPGPKVGSKHLRIG